MSHDARLVTNDRVEAEVIAFPGARLFGSARAWAADIVARPDAKARKRRRVAISMVSIRLQTAGVPSAAAEVEARAFAALLDCEIARLRNPRPPTPDTNTSEVA